MSGDDRAMLSSGIAIVGMAGRFPGARDINQFWQNIRDGVESVRFYSNEELPDLDPYLLRDPHYVKAEAQIDDIDRFDAVFFGYSPREARTMDPQHRLFLECAWEALEHAGHNPANFSGQIGVYASAATSTYLGYSHLFPNLAGDFYPVFIGNSQDFLSTRVSYKLRLKGPSLNVQTACSSSLVAVHMACQSLLNGESDLALAGGVSIRIADQPGYFYQPGGTASPDGHCRAFDARSQGTIFGNGLGVLVLRRLADALDDGDYIHAVIRGSAINNDGADKIGYTAPSVDGQTRVIVEALAMAEVSPETIGYVEAHGTATKLGDPIEIAALTQAFRTGTTKKGFCAIGTVKTNIGHLDVAAGIAGLMKTVLMLKHKLLPPHLHFEQPNPEIDFANSPFYVNTMLAEWRASSAPRRAGVSSFGMGGTNVHMVLEEAPAVPISSTSLHSPQLLCLSAKISDALDTIAQRYQSFLHEQPSVALSDICSTANTGRTHFAHRLAVVAESTEQVQRALAAFTERRPTPGLLQGHTKGGNLKVVFLFSGQGTQYRYMGQQLYATEPVFRAALDRCDALLRPYLDRSLLSVLYAESSMPTPLDETGFTQPALFALEYALAELWRSWGVSPDAVMGHSVGEYVAACVAGVFSLEDGLTLIARRGQLMQSLPPDGAMAAVFAHESRVRKLAQCCESDLSIAAINGPQETVIAGTRTAVQILLDQCRTEGITTRQLTVSHAFHSPLMDPILDTFEQVASSIRYSTPRLGLISNITGRFASNDEIGQASYWRQHIRQPVQFAKGLETLYHQGYRVFIEIGPGTNLLGIGQRCLLDDTVAWLPSLRKDRDDRQQILESLGAWYVQGGDIIWKGEGRRIPLPTYPFQRQRYWIEQSERRLNEAPVRLSSNAPGASDHPLLGRRIRSAAKDILFETEVSSDRPSFLADHLIYNTTVMPAAAYIEMAAAATRAAFSTRARVVEDLVFLEALVLPSETRRVMQIMLTPLHEQAATIQIFSLQTGEHASVEDNSWTLHASGTAHFGPPETPANSQMFRLDEFRGHFGAERTVGEYYDRLYACGVAYGPSFQRIERLWLHDAEALAYITLAESMDAEANVYETHPALLDACIQVFVAIVMEQMDTTRAGLYLPISVDRIRLYQQSSPRLWCHARLRPHSEPAMSAETVVGDLQLFNEAGQLVADIVGMRSKHAPRHALLVKQPPVHDWMYELAWQPKDLMYRGELCANATGGTWLIYVDRAGIGNRLAQMLNDLGESCMLVEYGEDDRAVIAGHHLGDLTDSAGIKQVLEEFVTASSRPLRGIVHLWNIDAIEEEPALVSLLAAQRRSCGSLLALVQALAASSILGTSRLWVVTRGAQAVGSVPMRPALMQSAVWGLGRVIARELPELSCTCIDLDPQHMTHHSQLLLEEIWSSDGNLQVALRQNQRYVARLRKIPSDTAASSGRSSELETPPKQLVIDRPGTFDGLVFKPSVRRQPAPHEVEIQVYASGLNFKDILNALGQYPGTDVSLGLECSGTITRLGANVHGLTIGDQVLALAPASFSSFVTVDAAMVARIPASISLEQAATIPVAFMTAHYGLHQLAGINKGDRVLIHTAAGGVGMAAVQLAQQAEAEVYATASPAKWPFLHAQGVEHVMNSRTLEFSAEVMARTGGRGVDVVLNMLAGDSIPHSLSVLRPHGYFIELGKRGVWDQRQVTQTRPDVVYRHFSLTEICQADPILCQSMLQTLLNWFGEGSLKPLPLRVIPATDIISAFRYMAQAKHVGKIVVTQTAAPTIPHAQDTPHIRADSTYLVTGGFGGLGLKVARWLVNQGAQQLVLVSRTVPSESVRTVLRDLEQQGAQIIVKCGDVAQEDQLAAILADIAHELPPLRGVVHAAGVIDDGALVQQTWERFARVMAPKVAGAWNLHTLTKTLSLDFFILFASSSGLLGTPGQGNYAAANVFLDALAYYRRTQGLPACSIDWGPWADTGMTAADHTSTHRKSPVHLGQIAPAQGIAALEHILQRDNIQIGVLPIKLGTSAAHFNDEPPFRLRATSVSATVAESSHRAAPQPELLSQLVQAPAARKRSLLAAYLRLQVINVLGLTLDYQVDPREPLHELGLDSLLAIELRNIVGRAIGKPLNATLLFDYPTIEALVEYLIVRVLGLERASEPFQHAETTHSELAQPEHVNQLSEDELDRLLDDELAKVDALTKGS